MISTTSKSGLIAYCGRAYGLRRGRPIERRRRGLGQIPQPGKFYQTPVDVSKSGMTLEQAGYLDGATKPTRSAADIFYDVAAGAYNIGYRVATGTPSPIEKAQQDAQVYGDLLRAAGGDVARAREAFQKYLVEVAAVRGQAEDEARASNLSTWLWLAVAGGAAYLILR